MYGWLEKTLVGAIGIVEHDGKIINVYFDDCDEFKNKLSNGTIVVNQTPLLREAFRQLDEYLAGRLSEFLLPLEPQGTQFQRNVWQALRQIPYGETASYKDIATMLGNPKASRAVGMANNKNPIPILIPCHRIIGNNGNLVGYRGGLELKQRLLEIEAG